jgi:predicted DNA binding CopG/RHH family protein
MEKPMKNQKLPQIDSIQALAEFWDTHDVTDFQEELEEVLQPVFEREALITLHLHSDEAETLRQLAQAKGLADTELIRKWILEKIHSN